MIRSGIEIYHVEQDNTANIDNELVCIFVGRKEIRSIDEIIKLVQTQLKDRTDLEFVYNKM